MMRSLVAGLMLSLVVFSGSVRGSVHDYTVYGMDGTEWVNVNNGTWLAWATIATGPDGQQIIYNGWYGEGIGNGCMLATAWAARPYEKITKVEFNYKYNANPSLYTPVIYKLGASETSLSSGTPIVWQASAAGWIEGRDSVTFSESENVQKMALGLNVPKWGYAGYFTEFSDVVITTVKNAGTGRVDGVVNNDEYDVVCYDLFGGGNAGGAWVSETHPKLDCNGNPVTSEPSITDLYRWGCKVENGVFYAFIELKNRDIGLIDSGSNNGPCSFYGFFINADDSSATGYAHKDFPNDAGFDLDLEVGSDFGYLGQAGTINFWYGLDDFDSHEAVANAQVYYLGNVLEISCPVADILTQTGVSAANGRFWRVAPRVSGKLPGSGVTDWEADVADAVVIDITNKAPKVIPVLDGVVSAEEWAGGLFCDKTLAGAYAEADGTAKGDAVEWTSDISRWGAKVINGVYYGFVEVDPSSDYSLDDYYNIYISSLGKYRRGYVNHFLDVDGNMTNGMDTYAGNGGEYNGSGFPANMDRMFDMTFEGGIEDTLSPMTLLLADASSSPVRTNIYEFWNTPGDSYVYEWSCPMSVIAASAANQGLSVAEFLRVSPRFNANLRDIGAWSTDISTPAIVRSITLLGGDANLDDKVDVGDLGILAANYGGAGKHWSQGDFNNDGKVDVGDLGILAANYGTNASGADFDADSAKVFGKEVIAEGGDEAPTVSSICSGLGLPLIAGLALMGLMLIKNEA